MFNKVFDTIGLILLGFVLAVATFVWLCNGCM